MSVVFGERRLELRLGRRRPCVRQCVSENGSGSVAPVFQLVYISCLSPQSVERESSSLPSDELVDVVPCFCRGVGGVSGGRRVSAVLATATNTERTPAGRGRCRRRY